MIGIFKDDMNEDAHDRFQRWRNANQDGFFVNQKSGRSAMLHVASCPHAGNTAWARGDWGSLTRNRKICSSDKEELLNWARNVQIPIKHCSDCKF